MAGKAYTGSDLKSDTANVTISESCTLSDATIDGDLYLTEGLASDAVQLNDVYVKGTIIVAGGTVTMTNTMSDHIVVSSPMGRLLQVTAAGAARFPNTEVRSTAVLYEKKLTTLGYEGFADVKINGDKKVSLTLDADINHLELDTESTVSTTANASVYRMTASKPASVTGYGTIYQAEIKSSGVSFASSVRVSGYTIANGVTATAGGQTLTGSVTAAVSPESIAVDLNNLSALGKNVAVTVPNGLKIEKIESNGAVLAAGTDYTQTSTGAAISADWLGRLPRGSYKLTLTLSDGKTTAIAIAVTDSSVSENVQNTSFDRYYKSANYADVHARLSGAIPRISGMWCSVCRASTTRSIPRRVRSSCRAVCWRASSGQLHHRVELKNGKTEAFTLTVSDSAPTGESWAVEEYNTFSPSEPKFTLPLTRTSVRTVTVQNNGVTEALNAGSDYTISGQTLTLKKSALERYRKDGAAVVFSADLADGTAYALVIDYVKRK
ncbi:MAG: X2-like carbohydrate binding domain-containing protein [Butyricicoccus sp.]